MALGGGTREYLAIVGERRRSVRIIPEGDSLRIAIDGTEWTVDESENCHGELSLLLDGKPKSVYVRSDTSGRYRVRFGRGEIDVEIADPILEKLARSGGIERRDEPIELRSPMPGTVIDIRVSVGDDVEPDTPLVVLEAMKMQNALASPVRGKIGKISIEPGQTVEGDALLIIIERDRAS